ncbi:bifunctional YncE family protein/alkaline phosphatase family protein [Novosphingobium lentum]|uniref:bifunctional YncE family protein/alkaline phosphatase family protein n=1 Tax=Novosphingobium lentum TaxID=145287 RepID=UPI00082EC357|nr:bifunctional YncE family protein/alkaline phosphatase family protein [Novosphingobium lentum]
MRFLFALLLGTASSMVSGQALASPPAPAPMLPTGQALTPLAAPGARFEPLVARTGPRPDTLADGASAMAMSPDGRTMLMLTSGFNRVNGADGAILPDQSNQYLFVYAVDDAGSHWLQTLTVPNSYSGVDWLPDGSGFVVGGGVDDVVHRFVRGAGGFAVAGAPIKLGHPGGNGFDVKPQAAGVAVSPDGRRVLVANYYNDSVSLIDLATGTVIAERDMRPGKVDPRQSGVAGGENPFAIVWTDNATAYVSAPRDRQIVRLAVNAGSVDVTARIAMLGEPTALLFDARAGRLYATQDNADRIAIVATGTGRLVAEPRLGMPAQMAVLPGKGTNPNALAQLPDGRLLVTMGGINALAIVRATATGAEVEGLVPTGWYPSAVAASRDGRHVFVANRKSPPGPNPQGCPPKNATVKAQANACGAANQYIFQLEKAGLLQFPMPDAGALVKTTLQVADNIGLSATASRAAAQARIAALRKKIRHVVFIVKENRTYDQVLGDLPIGNGDPSLAILGRRLTPNHHALAEQFVTLDNFYDSGEQSSTGWTWTTAGRVPDLLEKTAPVNYAQRGLAYEAEEVDRFIATSQTPAERHATNPQVPVDRDLLPGSALLTAPDGDDDDEQGQGFLWNAAIKAGLSVRNYGFSDASVYDTGLPGAVPLVREPFKTGQHIYTPADRLLATRSDPYFRGFDQKFPDFWLAKEWLREFAGQQKRNAMPALTLLRLSHDHFGDFKDAIDGVDTVETQMADNDFAVGMVIEAISTSKFRNDTLVFIIEDDAQNGADHVDARRSIAFVVGPYVRRQAVVSTRYDTVSMLRTIGSVLGLKPLGLNDALALPMVDVFDTVAHDWAYTARAAGVLATTKLPIPRDRLVAAAQPCPNHDAAYWTAAMAGQDFRHEDRLDTAKFNRALWQGLSGGVTQAHATAFPCL